MRRPSLRGLVRIYLRLRSIWKVKRMEPLRMINNSLACLDALTRSFILRCNRSILALLFLLPFTPFPFYRPCTFLKILLGSCLRTIMLFLYTCKSVDRGGEHEAPLRHKSTATAFGLYGSAHETIYRPPSGIEMF